MHEDLVADVALLLDTLTGMGSRICSRIRRSILYYTTTRDVVVLQMSTRRLLAVYEMIWSDWSFHYNSVNITWRRAVEPYRNVSKWMEAKMFINLYVEGKESWVQTLWNSWLQDAHLPISRLFEFAEQAMEPTTAGASVFFSSANFTDSTE